MKKRIGVFIGEVAQEYQKVIMQRIADRATKYGYDVIFICMYGSYKDGILYADGEASCLDFPDYSTFDGIIIAEDIMDITKIPDELYKKIKQNAMCPVVYLRTSRDEYYSILIDNVSAMRAMTRHFVEDHGFTDICYMSGKDYNSDAIERLQGFMEVMNKYSIPVTEHMIFHGDFWKRTGKQAAEWFMTNRTTFPQAIICANDYMAVSLADEFKKMGARIPEDICISGMDNVLDSKLYNPSLTTMEVDFLEIADKAVDIIENIYNGVEQELEHRVSAKLHLRGSCGCNMCEEIKSSITDLVHLKNETYSETRDLMLALTDYQECIEAKDYIHIADKHSHFLKADKAFLVMSDKESKDFNEIENESNYTEQVILQAIFTKDNPVQKYNIKFPRRKIIPDEFWNKEEPNVYCVFSIHYKAKVYGYMVTTLPSNENWFDVFTQGYLIMYANAIQTYESNLQIQDLEVIRSIYHNDSLTGILNRRGYDKVLQEKYNKAISENKVIGIVSIDMDNLKVINDTFGHAHGDNALKTIAKALEMSIKDGEYCARNGGDEFAAILDISTPYRSAEFKNTFLRHLKELSEKIEKYNVSASIGICESNEDGVTSLISCNQIADKRMYEDKKMRKIGRT